MSASSISREGKRSAICGSVLAPLYGLAPSRVWQSIIRKLVLRLEGGPVYSSTIREIYRVFHGVDVGMYTIGPCDVAPGNLSPGTTVGRYSSIYYTVRSLNRENRPTAGALFADSALGHRKLGKSERTLFIGNDVWAGHNVIILPMVEQIGDGAIIGAGSVVQSNIPPYAVATGNPARVVRYRFSEEKIRELLEAKWWLKSIDELGDEIEEFQRPLKGEVIR